VPSDERNPFWQRFSTSFVVSHLVSLLATQLMYSVLQIEIVLQYERS
jgi:hypothetical protein